jgi:hypothetical protein
MKAVFQPHISTDEIKQAQTFSSRDIQVYASEDLKREKRYTKRHLIYLMYGIAVVAFILAAVGVLGHFFHPRIAWWIVLGIIPFIILMNLIIRGGAPRQDTADSVTRTFYGQAHSPTSLNAYQVLSSTSVARKQANSLSRFKTSWADAYKAVEHEVLGGAVEGNGHDTHLQARPQDMRITSKFQTDRVSDVQCELPFQMTQSGKQVASGTLEFHNIAVRVDKKWYLLAGDPGEVSFTPT